MPNPSPATTTINPDLQAEMSYGGAERCLMLLASRPVTHANGHLLAKYSLPDVGTVFGWQQRQSGCEPPDKSERALPKLGYIHKLP